VDTLSIAGHGVVNFGSGVVNALGDTVDFVVDVGQTTFNAVSPSCWTKTFCAAIPDIPAIPIYGDPSLYQYSQMSGYATTMAAEFVLTGGVGALKSGTQVVVSGVKVVPRLVTELPAVVNEVKTVVKAVVPALREALPLIKSALSGAADDIVAIMQAPGEFAATLKTGLNNPITTPGGIFGTPATASGTTAAVETTSSTSAAANSGRGLSQYGGVVSEAGTNVAGGRIVTSTGTIAQEDFATFVQSGVMRGENVEILSGVHGYPSGTMAPEPGFFADDFREFGGLPGVTVHDVTAMSEEEVEAVLRGPGTIIGGFCNSAACLAPFH
jgi:hypothetical protein